MSNRIISKRSGSEGRTRPAAEKGKKQALVRSGARANIEKGDSLLAIDAKFTPDARKEVFAILDAALARAKKKDLRASIHRVEEKGARINVYTSDNHLALALGKQLHSARKGGELTITWSHDDKPVYVHWTVR
jgi:hypothetical protein